MAQLGVLGVQYRETLPSKVSHWDGYDEAAFPPPGGVAPLARILQSGLVKRGAHEGVEGGLSGDVRRGDHAG